MAFAAPTIGRFSARQTTNVQPQLTSALPTVLFVPTPIDVFNIFLVNVVLQDSSGVNQWKLVWKAFLNAPVKIRKFNVPKNRAIFGVQKVQTIVPNVRFALMAQRNNRVV
jgi:hypothetical protein